MFEIEGSHIAELNDADLRSLVGLLCEAELAAHGLSTAAVTWGGSQNAVDGGIDVRVRIQDGAAPRGFLPRLSIGFQVKKSDFTPGLITPEMRPSGNLRDSIKKLIDEGGAYILASSGSDTSDKALADRVHAMRSAVADEARHAALEVDFYDRGRLATWTRAHAGLVVWVRRKIGRGISGWQPHGSWAVSPDGVKDEYLFDEKVRLHAGISDDSGFDVTQGFDRVRSVLRDARGVVRLAGLSGVGKTRFVQALFDSRIGSSALNPALAIYTDMNDNPMPQPAGMISDLIASRVRAIVVVDNCAPELHRRLTEVCRASDSLVSVITIEYDVQEDEPEGTEVFRLEPSSVELVSKLIARRFPALTRLDVEKISEFSGGNARVALALANTLERHESVAGLHDEELFRRLFHQRKQPDDSLLAVAKACALLYSFQGEAMDGDDAELPKISALVGTSAQHIFAKIAQLRGRDLLQRRGVWRAVLPHAIANRLAKMALQEIHLNEIERQFDTERLLKSFSRRLGYLHESADAKRIVEKWLACDGLLGKVFQLNEFGIAMFSNVAPVSPEATLGAIERGVGQIDEAGFPDRLSMRERVATILRSIAYDSLLFDRCTAVLIALATAEALNSRSHSAGNSIKGLFQIFLSGTHASVEQRSLVVERLLKSESPARRSLGQELLQCLLQTDHFSATHSFEFGARVRDYGYWPNSREKRTHWFVSVLKMVRRVAAENGELAQSIRSKSAQAIQGVWFLGVEVQEQFERLADTIVGHGYWQEGWISVRVALSRPFGGADVLAIDRLRQFERRLQPRSVSDKVHAVVLTRTWGNLDFADAIEGEIESDNPMDAQAKAMAVAEELGNLVGVDEGLFESLLPCLVRGDGGRLVSFGKGLAVTSANPRHMWREIVQAIAAAEGDRPNSDVLIGFLVGLSALDEDLRENILDDAVVDDALVQLFPVLQISTGVSAAGVERLKCSLRSGKAHAASFRSLGWSRATDVVSGDDLRNIVLLLAELEDGYGVAVDVLSMRFHLDKDQSRSYSPELVDAGRSLLASPVFNDSDNMHDYRMGKLVDICLVGEGGSVVARSLCERIEQGRSDSTFGAYRYPTLIQAIFRSQPKVALDVFFGDAPKSQDSDLEIDSFESTSERRKNALDAVPMEDIIRWCDENPSQRYARMSKAVTYLAISEVDGAVEWAPIAIKMLQRAPDPMIVFESFVERFSPSSWSGSRAAIIEARLPLLDRLDSLGNASFQKFADKARPQIMREIESIRRWEDERDSERDERFE